MIHHHPMQPVIMAKDKVIRFKANPIIRWMLDQGNTGCGFDLNVIAVVSSELGWKKEDHMQLAQLLGYSVSGYSDLSYASRKSVDEADKKASRFYTKKKRKK